MPREESRQPIDARLAPRRRVVLARFAAALLLLAVPSLGVRAAAQGRGDIRAVQISHLRGHVGLAIVNERDDRSNAGTTTIAYKRLQFIQLLDTDLAGYAYHPRFLDFRGDLQLELRQDPLASTNDLLVGTDWNLNFFREHPYGFSLFGRVLQNQVPRRFAAAYDINTAGYGAAFHSRKGFLPFDLSYTRSTRQGGLNDAIDEVRDEASFRGRYRIEDHTRGKLNYDALFQERQGSSLRRQAFNAHSATSFDPGQRKRLNTNVLLREQNSGRRSGEDPGRQLYTAAGMFDFDWHHRSNLSSHYLLDFRWDDQDAQKLTNINPSASLAHQLYGSLESRLEFYGRLQNASFGDRDEYGGRLSENYTKRLSTWGRLSSNISGLANFTKNRPQLTEGLVLDEQHAVPPSFEFQLSRPSVDQASVVVTDDTGAVTYVLDLDYRLREEGLRTVVEVLLAGSIAVGETLLVDYTFEPAGRSDILTTSFDVGADLSVYDRFSIYGRFNNIDRDLLEGDARTLRISPYDRRRVAGAKLAWPWLTARAEFEDFDSTIGPFESFDGSVSLSTSERSVWNSFLTGAFRHQEFTDTDRTINRVLASYRATRSLLTRGFLTLQGDYLRERWGGPFEEGANDVDAIRLDGAYTWWYGRAQITLDGRYARIFRTTQDENHYLISLRMRREF